MTSRFWAPILIGTLLTSCTGEPRSDRLALLPLGADLELDHPPLVEVGGHSTRESHTFGRVGATLLIADSLLVVADALNKELRVFDRGAKLARRIGRSGSGPGEFRMLSDVAFEGGQLHVWDVGTRRLTSFDLDGSTVATTGVRVSGGVPRFVGVMEDGSWLLRRASFEQSTLTKEGRSRETETFDHFDRTGDLVRSYSRPGPEMFFESKDGMRTGASIILSRNTLAAAGGNRIYLGETGEGVVEALDLAGGLVRQVTLPGPLRLATGEELRKLAARRPPEPPGSISMTRELPRPASPPARDTFPVFDRLMVDSDDRLWIRETVGPLDTLKTWLVMSPDLEVRARLPIDADADLLDAAGRSVVLLTRDSLDVPTVRVWRLAPASHPPSQF